MVYILPVASGKGGVGKSSLAVNLAVSLAQKGKKVVLVDLDLGGANLHTLLGLKNNHAGLGNFIYRQTDTFQSLLQETGIANLQFIAGDCLFPGTANITFFMKRRIFKELQKLDADYALLDLGAGAAYNTLDFFLLTSNSLLVTTPEITSILNAYSFLKAAVYRYFTGQFKNKSEERSMIQNYIQTSTAGAESSFTDLVQKICTAFPDSGAKAAAELAKYRPQIIMNMGSSTQDLEMARRLRSLVESRLTIKVDFVGFISKDASLPLSVARRKPLILLEPNGIFAEQVIAAAERIMLHTYDYNETFAENMLPAEPDSSDIDMLTDEFSTISGKTQIG